MKLRVTNEQIILFSQNADATIRNMSRFNKRTRYLSCLQRAFDFVQPTIKSIEKKQRALSEKYALTNPDTQEFILTPQGQMSYSKETSQQFREETDKFHEETRELKDYPQECYLTINDLPKDTQGGLSITNQLLKVLAPFVITQQLCDQIIYGYEVEGEQKNTAQLELNGTPDPQLEDHHNV